MSSHDDDDQEMPGPALMTAFVVGGIIAVVGAIGCFAWLLRAIWYAL